eukprot:gene7951-7356_t
MSGRRTGYARPTSASPRDCNLITGVSFSSQPQPCVGASGLHPTRREGPPSHEFSVKGQRGRIPKLGFGTATLTGERAAARVATALKAGYRHVDTALLYGNQVAVGKAIRDSGVPREDIWVTSKVAFFPK